MMLLEEVHCGMILEEGVSVGGSSLLEEVHCWMMLELEEVHCWMMLVLEEVPRLIIRSSILGLSL